MDDPKNNRAPLLCYLKLFASFRSLWWMQTGVTIRKCLIWVKIDAFLSRVTLKFYRWPSKTKGHLFYATSSFVQHFVAIGEFKLELESGNAQSGSNAALFRAVWPWNLTDDLENNRAPLLCYFKLCASFRNHWWIQTGVRVRKRPIWVKFDAFLEPCDLEIWRMTFKNNRAPLLCYFKLSAAFRSHWWIQTWVRVRKRPIWVKCYVFLEPCDLEIWRMTLKNNRAPLLCYFVHHFVAIGEFKLELESGNAQSGSNATFF